MSEREGKSVVALNCDRFLAEVERGQTVPELRLAASEESLRYAELRCQHAMMVIGVGVLTMADIHVKMRHSGKQIHMQRA
jgi:hypothetical protein